MQQRENEKRVQEEQNSINQVLWGLIENNAVQTINMPELDESKKHKMLDILLEIKSIQDQSFQEKEQMNFPKSSFKAMTNSPAPIQNAQRRLTQQVSERVLDTEK